MHMLYRGKPAWPVAGLRIAFLVLIALLLLPAPAPAQSAWPSGDAPTFLPGESAVGPGNLSPAGIRSAAPGRENRDRHPARFPVANRPTGGFHHNLAVLPAASVWHPAQCPLPPASAFHLQKNLRLYLEAWPTPGSTAAEPWPEYIPEDGEDVD